MLYYCGDSGETIKHRHLMSLLDDLRNDDGKVNRDKTGKYTVVFPDGEVRTFAPVIGR